MDKPRPKCICNSFGYSPRGTGQRVTCEVHTRTPTELEDARQAAEELAAREKRRG